MYSASSTYLNHIDNSITRKPKSKIVVDGVTYTGETHLKTYPKFSHSTSKMIGGFSAATCEFEIYNRDGRLSLNGKEVTVYRGLEINGAVTWIPMGIFSANDENITNNKTAKTIMFKGSDRASKFDVAYVAGSDITFPCTLLQFVGALCARRGITLADRSFPMATMTLNAAPNIAADVTERQLIACAAELGGCTAKISRYGTLYIRKPTATGRTVSKLKYSAVSREPTFGPINSIALGHASYDDDIVYPATPPTNLCEWRIEDNPFVESNREAIISTVAANIIGMSFTPFKVSDFIDDFIFDLNDQVTIEDKDGSTFTATILSLATSSRIRSEFKADAQAGRATNRKIAGSMKDSVKQVKLLVDHQNNRINSLVENSVSKTELEQTASALTVRIDNLDTPSGIKSTYVTIDSEGLTVTNGAFMLKDDRGNALVEIKGDESGNMFVSGTIRASSVEANAITSESIESGAITAKHISAGAITAEKLNVGWSGGNYAACTADEWSDFTKKSYLSISTDDTSYLPKITVGTSTASTYAIIKTPYFYCAAGAEIKVSFTSYPYYSSSSSRYMEVTVEKEGASSGILTLNTKSDPVNTETKHAGEATIKESGYYCITFMSNGCYASSYITDLIATQSVKGEMVVNGKIISIDGKTYFDLDNSILATADARITGGYVQIGGDDYHTKIEDGALTQHLNTGNSAVGGLVPTASDSYIAQTLYYEAANGLDIAKNAGADGFITIMSFTTGAITTNTLIKSENALFTGHQHTRTDTGTTVKLGAGKDVPLWNGGYKESSVAIELTDPETYSDGGGIVARLDVAPSWGSACGVLSLHGRNSNGSLIRSAPLELGTSEMWFNGKAILAPIAEIETLKSSLAALPSLSYDSYFMQIGTLKILAGQVSNVSTNGASVSISSAGFSNAPKVFVTPLQTYAGADHIIAANIKSVSKTAFTVVAKDMLGSYGSDIMWVAIGN